MQLVSVEVLLVLSMLTLPAVSARLPQSQASDAASTGHLLYRRTDGAAWPSQGLNAGGSLNTPSMTVGSSAAINYHFTPSINAQLSAGVFRRPEEGQFYELFHSIISAAIDREISANHRAELLRLCGKAQATIAAQPSGPTQYDKFFAKSLLSTAISEARSRTLKASLATISYRPIKPFDADPLPREVAEAIDEMIAASRPSFEEQKVAIYGFLRQRVFGYAIQPTAETDGMIRALAFRNLEDRANLVIELVDTLGADYHSSRISDAIGSV